VLLLALQIADPVENVAETVAAHFGIARWTKDASEVFSDPEIDAVVICSPTALHAEQIIEAAKHKKQIFCEKPVDFSVEVVNQAIKAVRGGTRAGLIVLRVGADMLSVQADDAGVKLMIGFNRRFDANFARVKQAIDRDEIGKVNMLRITSRDPGAPPIEYVKVSGGLFRDMTIHDFDMARFLVGDEVDEVFAMAQSVNADIAAAGDVDTAVVLLKFRNGVLCYIENSREAAYGYDQRVEALGSKGSVACDNKHSNQVVVSTSESVRRDLPLHFFLERYMDAYVAEMEAFIRVCTTDGASVPVGGEDGREALLLALAANKSLAENRPVKVDELRA
jgi:myo-inositol 2-dehydrogenase/D-chiro-inositol 1-dehydrogenase